MREFLRNSILICISLLLWIETASSNPTFQKVPCDFVPDNVKYDLCLYVSFPDQTDDWMLLHKVHGEETVFKGSLYNEGTRVCVVVEDASNPDDIEVVMHSKHSGGKMFFHTDLRGRGPADIIDIPPHSDVYLIPPNDTFTNRGASLKDRNLPFRALPSNGFSLNVHVFYDDTFNAQFGSDATTRITAIFTIVETIYSDASLTSVIDPNIIQISYISGASWEATEPILRDVSSNIAVPSTSNGNAYVFLCYQNNQGGVVGIAWVRGTCSSSRFGRSSVNEYLSNDVVTASIVAHEIGHNLGMRHDFGSTTSVPRFSSTGEACTGIGGYMDYQPNPNKWSPCSVEDYTSYFESVNPWCLSPLPNEVTTTTTTITTTTTTTPTTTTTITSTSTMVTSTTTRMSTTTNTRTTSTTTSTTSETSTESSGETSSSTITSTSTSDSDTTSTNDATTTEEQCTDKYWCRWKPQWTCRYWTIVREYCPNKCGTCNGEETTTTTTPTPPTCEDRFSIWCRWNQWRCGFSTSIRRNCPKSCNLC